LNELIKIDGFKNVVKLREIGRILDFKLLNSDTWIILNLDIHTSNNINEIIENCQTKIEGKLNDYIKERYDFYNENLIESLYSEIDLRNTFLNEFKSEGDLEDYEKIIKILNQEKIRIGSPDANLLVENVKFRIQNNIWD
jgi:transposase-like protein